MVRVDLAHVQAAMRPQPVDCGGTPGRTSVALRTASRNIAAAVGLRGHQPCGPRPWPGSHRRNGAAAVGCGGPALPCSRLRSTRCSNGAAASGCGDRRLLAQPRRSLRAAVMVPQPWPGPTPRHRGPREGRTCRRAGAAAVGREDAPSRRRERCELRRAAMVPQPWLRRRQSLVQGLEGGNLAVMVPQPRAAETPPKPFHVWEPSLPQWCRSSALRICDRQNHVEPVLLPVVMVPQPVGLRRGSDLASAWSVRSSCRNRAAAPGCGDTRPWRTASACGCGRNGAAAVGCGDTSVKLLQCFNLNVAKMVPQPQAAERNYGRSSVGVEPRLPQWCRS